MLLQSKLEDALQNVPPKNWHNKEKDAYCSYSVTQKISGSDEKLTTNISENEIAGLNERN